MHYATPRSIFLSIVLHVFAGGLLLLSLDFDPPPVQIDKPRINVIDAVTVDIKQIEAELSRLKEIDKQKEAEQIKKQKDLEKKLKNLEKKAADTEKKRKAEEKRLATLKKNQQAEKKKREQEELKLAEVKKQQEELEIKRRQEEQQRKLDELKQKQEQQKRKLAEEALKQQLAEEQQQHEEAQAKQDLSVIDQYVAKIKNAIEREFNTTGLQPGLSCVFRIRMIPGGDVVESKIIKPSGDAVFDSRAETALKKASPLPVADNPRIFDKMRVIRFTFEPK